MHTPQAAMHTAACMELTSAAECEAHVQPMHSSAPVPARSIPPAMLAHASLL
jgi:hypothetical protein